MPIRYLIVEEEGGVSEKSGIRVVNALDQYQYKMVHCKLCFGVKGTIHEKQRRVRVYLEVV